MSIINGVEVEGCRHLKNDGIKKPICRSGGCTGAYKSCLCIKNENCDYKQLQRVKAENEKLNKTLQKIKEIVIEPCIDGESCETCNSNCTNKDILTLIKKVEERCQ